MDNTQKGLFTEDIDNFNRMVGARIREQREEHHLSQQQVSNYLGLSKQKYLSEFESGLRPVKMIYIAKLSKLFRCTSDYLIGISDSPSLIITERIACDYTGLSEKSVNTLADIDKEYRIENGNIIPLQKTIDILLSSDTEDFYDALCCLRDTIDDINESEKALQEYSYEELEEFFCTKMDGIGKSLKVNAYDVNNEFNILISNTFCIEQAKETLHKNKSLIYERLRNENG